MISGSESSHLPPSCVWITIPTYLQSWPEASAVNMKACLSIHSKKTGAKAGSELEEFGQFFTALSSST